MLGSRSPICRYEIGETCDRKPWPPTMTSVDTTTRNGIGVSLRACPVAAITNATQAPSASGSNSPHRLWMITPATRASAKMRIIVTRRRMAPNSGSVYPASAHVVAPGSMFLASPGAGQVSTARVAVPIGAAREFCATYRRTVCAQHAELRHGQTTLGGLFVTVWSAVPPCKERLQNGRPQPHGCWCVRAVYAKHAE
jgi:hypothetical protein